MPPTLVKTGLKAESGGLAQLSQEVKVGNHVIYKNGIIPNSKVLPLQFTVYPSTPTTGFHDTYIR